ncbi:MAG: extracellular solute-binding protein [Spirochaetes bacterium]|nr:extracellular solute-binding protein [Spirochaetota bacterium]MBU1080971.1 extracellular solute-binding protein [Spirochaetota bacterium]
MKRTLVVAAAVAMAVFALSGCAKKVESTKLVYWSMWNQTEPQAQVIEAAVRDFESKNPGVSVEINWNGREIRKTLQPALDNKQVIDLWDEDIERVVKTWGAYALRLDDYLGKSFPTTGGKAYKDSVMGSLVDLARSYSSDKGLYAVPYQPFLFAFMYNKEHFAKAGVTATPRSWDELLDAMAKLKSAGFVPMTVDDAYMDTLPGYYLARAKGYPWVQSLVKDKTNAMWDDPAVMQMAKAFENLAKMGYLSKTVSSNKWPAGQQDVASGAVTMYLNGTWLVNEIMGTTGPDFKWGTFSFPTVPNGKDDGTAANYGAQAFQINKNCATPDLAFALVAHLTTGAWDAELAKKSYGVPVGGTTEWPAQLAEAKAIFENLKTCYPWAAGIQADTDKLPVIVENFTRLVGGTVTAEQFVAAMKR